MAKAFVRAWVSTGIGSGIVAVGAVIAACSSSTPSSPASPSGVDASIPAIVLSNPCTDSIASVYADPGPLPADKGAIIRCAFDKTITQADLLAQAKAGGYMGKPFTSGARVYRVLYRTERGDAAASPGYSSAIVYLPDTPRAAKLPAWVVSHGSRGQAAVCAPSLANPAADDVRTDFEAIVFPPVGGGYAVIAPDLAGYSNYGAAGNPPSGYALANDVAKSTLDGVRALQKLVPSSLSGTDTVISGHSQGGHSALAALAQAQAYAPEETIKAVVVFAPLWIPQRTWGGLFLLSSQYPIATSPTPDAVSVWYHYSHAELLDGPGAGIALFKPAVQAGIRQFFDTTCWAAGYPNLAALGQTVSDLYDPAFQQTVSAAAGIGSACTSSVNPTLCQTWIDRYQADRPHLSGTAASVPILVGYGDQDTTIPPDRFACALDRLVQDKASSTVCVEPTAEHGGNNGVTRYLADYANDWVASKTLGAAAPAACAHGAEAVRLDGGTATCDTIPPND